MKKSEKNIKEMMNKLDLAYNDPAINKRPDLKKMVLSYATELNKNGNVDLLSSKLCKRISLEYIQNKKDFPKTIIDLYYSCKGHETKYDGIAMSAILGGTVWFH